MKSTLFHSVKTLSLLQKNSVQSYVKKTFATPLTFDFQLESKEAITPTSTSMTVPQSREDKPHGITKTKR